MSSTPGPARDVMRAIVRAVDAAVSGSDAAAYESRTAQLAAKPISGRVLGDVLRLLLEDTHPEGFSSEDITLLTGRCYRAAAAWLPPKRIDAIILLAVLAGALGIHEPAITYEQLDLPHPGTGGYRDLGDTVPVEPPAWPDYAWHAPLLVADLLPFAPAMLDAYLEAIFAEYAREAREEHP
jgi:hypothetical protein